MFTSIILNKLSKIFLNLLPIIFYQKIEKGDFFKYWQTTISQISNQALHYCKWVFNKDKIVKVKL